MRTISAAIIGIIICSIVIFIIEMIGMKLFPVQVKINPKNYNDLKALIDNIPLPALIIIIVGHGISLFVGVFVSHKIQNKSTIPFLLVFLVMLMVTISNLAMIPHPLWFMIADIGSVCLAGLISWRVLSWK
ncbi:MAG: hypothetical protein RI883_2054 [Bacteroidota bacterium]|jgi:hydrogenase-4 membrane subunit HyfE